jgi:pimeloyl-ACP methyl ester carboxylesterase
MLTAPRRSVLVAVLLAFLPAIGTACAAPVPDVPPYAVATQNDPKFTGTFRHEFADVGGVRMHYVTGGHGSPVVLLHGWPQTWFGWWPVLPALAQQHTVYAVDLPGLGDSTGSPTGYDKATLARYVHALIADRLGVRDAAAVGHDLGAAVAFQYADQFPADTTRLGYLDLPRPGPAINAATYRTLSWHIAFHAQPQVSLDGKAFGGSSDRSPFTGAEIDEYTRTYSRPEVLSGGFELYRSLDQDVRATVSARLTDIVRAVDVPHAGHWLVEENPQFVTG